MSNESFGGSIGVILQLYDISKQMEADGIGLVTVTTSPFKAIGSPGAEITPEHVEYLAGLVGKMGGFFFSAIQEGRGLSAEQLARVTTGEEFGAKEMLDYGLVDDIMTWGEAFETPVDTGLAGRRASNNGEKNMPTAREQAFLDLALGKSPVPEGENADYMKGYEQACKDVAAANANSQPVVPSAAAPQVEPAPATPAPAASAQPEGEPTASDVAKQLRDEQTSVIDICEQSGHADLIPRAIKEGWTVTFAQALVLELDAKKDEGVQIGASLPTGATEPAVRPVAVTPKSQSDAFGAMNPARKKTQVAH